MSDPPKRKATHTRVQASVGSGDNESDSCVAEENTKPVVNVKYDVWLCRYLFWLISQNIRHGGDEPISEYALEIAAGRFTVFSRSGHACDRFLAWESVQAAASWLGQMDQGGMS